MGVDRPLGLSQSLRRTLRFTKLYGFSVATGGYTEATLYLNSAYNVDTASSAVGYAKYMAFYSKCFVIGARIKTFITNASGIAIGSAYAGANPTTVGIVVTTNITSLGSQTAAQENGFCRFHVLGNNPDTVQLSESVDVSRFLHKPRVLDDPQLFSTTSAIPGQLVVAHLFAQAAATSTNTSVYMNVTVDLECVFTDPIVFT